MRINRLVNLFIAIAIFVFLPGCGDDEPAVAPTASSGAPSPTPPADVPTGFTWERVHFSDLLPDPPDACSEPEIFRVTKDGGWTWNFCVDERAGSVTTEELGELDRRVRAVSDAGINGEVCLELSYEGRRILEVRFPPERDERVHDLGRKGSCFRGDMPKVNDLEDYVDGLRVKYAGFTTGD